mmetsp:Transcript_2900/g.6146  ORF Transcript_2900/g.6146 Transcript_2900/m.6146 type:complete len:198 (+) Transcript_2900:341-934(+)
MQQQRQPQQSPTAQMLLSSQWVSMSAAFAENHVGDGDGRLWEYVGTDGQVHGPFGSPQMNLWRAHGFFNSEQNLHLRLTNPPPQGGGGGGGGGGKKKRSRSRSPVVRSEKPPSSTSSLKKARGAAEDDDDDDREDARSGKAKKRHKEKREKKEKKEKKHKKEKKSEKRVDPESGPGETEERGFKYSEFFNKSDSDSD